MPETVPDSSPPAPLGDTYTSRPVSITARQWDGTIDGGRRVIDWAEGAVIRWSNETPQRLVVETLEGRMTANPGDWIIKGTEGEFYPCKDSVFQRKYHRAAGGNPYSIIQLYRHEYAENSFILSAFTGKLLLSRQDLEEAYRQLDDFLYPNPGFEPRIAEVPK